MLRVWGRPTSICTQRVLWACVEAGVEFELTLASATMGRGGHISTGAQPYGSVETPWYRAMNPNRTVPTIDDDGFVLWESNAIVGYIAARYARETLFGDSEKTYALASQWMSWTNQRLEPPLHTLVMELSRLREDLRTARAAASVVEAIAPALDILDERLGHSTFVAGDAFSMGDIPTGAAVYRWKVFGLGGPPTPHIEAWLTKLAAREGFRRHVEPREFQI